MCGLEPQLLGLLLLLLGRVSHIYLFQLEGGPILIKRLVVGNLIFLSRLFKGWFCQAFTLVGNEHALLEGGPAQDPIILQIHLE
jgi:hypothetical protein